MPYLAENGEIYYAEVERDDTGEPIKDGVGNYLVKKIRPITDRDELKTALNTLIREFNTGELPNQAGALYDPKNEEHRAIFRSLIGAKYGEVYGFPQEPLSDPAPVIALEKPIQQPLIAGNSVDGGLSTDGTNAAGGPVGGDPVLLASGQLYHQVTDLEVAGRGLSFAFTRTYLSQMLYKGPLGFNWDHSYNLWAHKTREERSNGTLQDVVYVSTGTLREDRYVRNGGGSSNGDAEYLPPEGSYDRLQGTDTGYVLETVSGLRYYYDSGDQDDGYRFVSRIVDLNENVVSFEYDEQRRLRRVIDSVGKEFRFEYDELNRVSRLIDTVGERSVHYYYSDNGDLYEVDFDLEPDLVTSTDYRYSGPDNPYELQHDLVEIINSLGESVLETEYGTDPGSWSYGRVTYQRSETGEFLYEYAPVIESTVDPGEDSTNIPENTTIITYPNGHVIEHWLNNQGNVVRRLEQIINGGTIETLEAEYDYNEDGLPVREAFADGSVIEYVYGREAFADRHGGSTAEASPLDRLTFGNLNRTIQRSRSGMGDSRCIVTDYAYESREAVGGARRLKATRGPYYTDTLLDELSGQVVGTTTYSYDGSGNLRMVSFSDVEQPDGTTMTPEPIRYEYGDGHGLVTDVFVGGEHMRYEYFPDEKRSGFVQTVIEDPEGIARSTEYDVDDLGRLVRVVDTYGAATDTEWTTFDTPRTTTLPAVAEGHDRSTITYLYDRNRQVVRTEERLLNHDGSAHPDETYIETYRYDKHGRQVKQTQGSAADPSTRVFRTAYNRSSLHERVVDALGTVTHIEYDERLLPRRVTQAWGRPEETTKIMRYNRAGALRFLTNGRGAVTEYEYDSFGRVRLVRDPDGNETKYEYDAAGRITQQVLSGSSPSGSDSGRWGETTYEYDTLGRAIAIHRHLFDPNERPTDPTADRRVTTRYFYEKYGQLERVLDPTGAESHFEYDAVGRTVLARDPDGNETKWTYDDANRRVNVTRTTIGTDADGDPLTYVTRNTTRFDSRGYPIEATDPAGNKTRIAYDSRGNPAVTVDAEGVRQEIKYDVLGRISQTHTGLPGKNVVTAFEYDNADNLISIIDPIETQVRFEYDALGRNIRAIRGDTARTYGYDTEGLCTEISDESGTVLTREYSPGGRLLVETPDTSVFVPPLGMAGYTPHSVGVSKFTYTPAGQIARAENRTAVVTRRYDSLGRLRQDAIDGRTVSMDYNDAGRLELLTYPDDRQIKYEYTPAGHLEDVTQVAAGSEFPGDPTLPGTRSLLSARRVGERATHLDVGPVVAVFGYDSRLTPVSADWRRHDGTDLLRERRLFGPRGECRIEQFDSRLRVADFDPLLRQISAEDRESAPLIDVSSLAPPASVAELRDDGQQREDVLRANVDTSGTVERLFEYHLDNNTNRTYTTLTEGATPTQATNYTLGAFDRYERVGGDEYIYDRAGNLLDDGDRSFAYDPYDQLAAVITANGSTEIAYDALGRVIEWKQQGSSKRPIYSDGQIIEWRSGSSLTLEAQVVPIGNGFCHLAAGGEDFVPLQDLGGTIQGWVKASGQVAGRRIYDSFGQIYSQQDDWPAPFGFRGYLEDEYNGLNLLFARAYDPKVGRFLQRDPAGFVDGTNLYSYAGHAPMNATDAWGFRKQENDWADPVRNTNTASTPLGEFGLGILEGGAEMVTEAIQAGLKRRANPTLYDIMNMISIGATIQEGYREDGLSGVVNVFNPLSHLLKAGYLADEEAGRGLDALQRGESEVATAHFRSSGRQYWYAIAAAVSLGMVVAGGAQSGATAIKNVRTRGLPGSANRSMTKALNQSEFQPSASAHAAAPSVFQQESALTGPPSNPRAYSTAYQFKLDPADIGRSRGVHKRRGRAALRADMQDPAFAAYMETIAPGTAQRLASGQNPLNWTWEHASTSTTLNNVTGMREIGVLRLVPTSQHTPGSPFWRVLHPDRGARGGYSEWAIPAGAPKNRKR